MQEFGGPESYTPGEGAGQTKEGVSEQAREKFQQAAQQIKQILREEKKARRRDDRVAQTILQFLGEDQYAHLFQLIARLAARDCPSIFILAVLSLIHRGSHEAVEEYIAENKISIKDPADSAALFKGGKLPPEIKKTLLLWIQRLQLIMSIYAEKILLKLMVDESNIDGAVLQLTTFVLVDFFESEKLPIPYQELQPLTIKILQDVIEPHLPRIEQYFKKPVEEDKDDE
ncbi:hypothetical protein A3A67_03505 [Candidatus Peribacteria bacterium RIFCSPLOWO2_01_FULL_51_18]|nr:MAG: hypothetical protein A3C52_05245 [Candidatus Peribacteria bacterium RIFCSPHIGHO2_02_FULL_51_15]OGJ66524.1 MAG: hypothetical protein A3A67_03505 [Candidatus Peribacteria bacterium RIFCSPLOWO2_01_FULL_51_18]OGJ67464.1 MAG: hypothetical protein A3J34_03920 [Candidatus Peribacteria bacterium RIFCSPLOWO2_02_FULL_51_10]